MTERLRQRLAEAAVRLAAQIPEEIILRFLAELERIGRDGAVRAAEELPSPLYRRLGVEFLNAWRVRFAELSVREVAAALITAAVSEAIHRGRQSLELVWTGPTTGSIPARQTEQVLLQLIQSATRSLTIVSYVVYKIPHIATALVQAAERGVTIQLIVEAEEPSAALKYVSGLCAPAGNAPSRIKVYIWPREKRSADAEGRTGLMHVKCAVADGRQLFLSSANLTESALTLNMELGILIIGGPQPSAVETHLRQLITEGLLVPLG
jgi:phosphatidylserine/phosphatidylglycerophosphate/cardiolipin synthase-like enzyme